MSIRQMIPIDECPAGPALDAACAKVVGWTDDSPSRDNSTAHVTVLSDSAPTFPHSKRMPSTRLEDAWALVDWMRGRGRAAERREYESA